MYVQGEMGTAGDGTASFTVYITSSISHRTEQKCYNGRNRLGYGKKTTTDGYDSKGVAGASGWNELAPSQHVGMCVWEHGQGQF